MATKFRHQKVNTQHRSLRAYCCPKCEYEMACLSLRLSCDTYFPVNCNEEFRHQKVNTQHRSLRACCPKCEYEMACLSLRLSCDMYFPVNCNEECSLFVSHKQEFFFTGYNYMVWHNLFANMRPLHKTEMEVSLIIIHMDDCSLPFKGMHETKCHV